VSNVRARGSLAPMAISRSALVEFARSGGFTAGVCTSRSSIYVELLVDRVDEEARLRAWLKLDAACTARRLHRLYFKPIDRGDLLMVEQLARRP